MSYNLIIIEDQQFNSQIQVMEEEKIDSSVLQRFKVIKKMGSGAYGHVFKVQDRYDHKIKALKKNFDAFVNSTDAQRTYRQIMFLFQLKHPNIIELFEVIKAKNGRDIYLVFQFYDATLYDVSRTKGVLTEKHRKYILYQVAHAIYYLHSAGIMHRDLKPANVLVNQSCTIKVIDFGLVRSIQENQNEEVEDIMTEYIATRWYRAPEIILGSHQYSKAVDIWSLGCLIAEICSGKALFPGTSTLNQIQRVLKWTGVPSVVDLKSLKTNFGKQLLDLVSHIKPVDKYQLLPNVDPQCMDLINRCLQFNVEKRITIQQVLMHPYFGGHFNPKELIKSKKKASVPVKDSDKLTLKQYRSLIYTGISKYNLKSENFHTETKHLKTQDEPKSQIYPQKSRLKSKPSKQIKNVSDIINSKSNQLKTLKYNVNPKKRKFFDSTNGWEEPLKRIGSRQTNKRKRFSRDSSLVRGQNTNTVVVRPKRFSTDWSHKKKAI